MPPLRGLGEKYLSRELPECRHSRGWRTIPIDNSHAAPPQCHCTSSLALSNMMMFRTNPSSGVPIYLQLMEQIKHAIETGALRPGEQLPGMRPLAEELVINPNTVAKVYRELEHEGVIELRHGAGAFVAPNARAKRQTDRLRAGQDVMAAAIEKLRGRGITDEEIRRLVEAELARKGKA